MKKWFKRFQMDNRGIGVVEIILILVILIALVIVFRDQIFGLVKNIFGKITDSSTNVLSTTPTI